MVSHHARPRGPTVFESITLRRVRTCPYESSDILLISNLTSKLSHINSQINTRLARFRELPVYFVSAPFFSKLPLKIAHLFTQFRPLFIPL